MIHPDGRFQDRLGNVVSELVTDGGTLTMRLGHQGGIGSIVLGTHPEFDMLEQGQEYGEKPHKLVYTPGEADSLTKGNSFEDGKIFYNDEVVVDFVRGYMDARIHIRPIGDGSDRYVTYENKQIGTLWVYRDPSLPLQPTMLHPDYKTQDVNFGGSSTSTLAIGIYLKSPLSE